jgi:hypothetical protein
MTKGIPNDPTKKHAYNGAGMKSLAPEVRTHIMEVASAKQRAMTSGWPECFQKGWDIVSLSACTWEWDRLMANTASRRTHG